MRVSSLKHCGRVALHGSAVVRATGGEALQFDKVIHGCSGDESLQEPAKPSMQRDVNFSGSGFLACYHLGAANALVQHGVITPSSRLGGASGGSLVAASLASGVPIHHAFASFLAMAAECRQHGTIGKLDAHLLQLLDETLPPDAAARCNGRVVIAVTRVRPHPRVEPELISRFRGRGDLVESLVSSCFLPGYLAMRPTNRWRGGSYVDGGLRHVLPPLPGFLNVLCFPPAWFLRLRHLPADAAKGNSLISPALTPSMPYSFSRMLSHALIPPPEPVLVDLFHWGEAAAQRWLAGHHHHHDHHDAEGGGHWQRDTGSRGHGDSSDSTRSLSHAFNPASAREFRVGLSRQRRDDSEAASGARGPHRDRDAPSLSGVSEPPSRRGVHTGRGSDHDDKPVT